MGLKETMQSVAQTLVAATGTIRKSVIYKSKSANPTYNPSTGAVTEAETSYTVQAVLDMSPSGLGSAIGLGDVKNLAVNKNLKTVYIPKLDLTPTPKITDEIVIDTVTWEIEDINIDPADALWILSIKKP